MDFITVPPVLTIELGRQLTVPECQSTEHPTPPASECIRTSSRSWGVIASQPGLGTNAFLDVPFNSPSESFLHEQAGIIYTEGGVVQSITLTTKGIVGQDIALSVLRAKFGLPNSIRRPLKENLMRVQVRTIEARWTKSGYSVSFSSVVDDISHGEINIQTDAYTAGIARLHNKPAL
jgi:hypothetical protein